jgi:putative transferase (TIGR04331 family)
MTYLATTALTSLWDTTGDVLLLGSWCLSYDRREEWQHLHYSRAPNPWEDREAVYEASAYCEATVDRFLLALAPWLDDVHGERHDERYWRILLRPWLTYYVHGVYERYVSLRQAAARYAGLWTHVLEESCYRTPVDTPHATSLLSGEDADWFNFQVCSQIVKASPKWDVSPVEISPAGWPWSATSVAPVAAAALRRRAKAATARLFRLAMGVLRPRVMLGEVQLCRADLARLVMAMAFRGGAIPLARVPSVAAERDGALRKSLADLVADDEFSTVVSQTLPFNVPLIFLEGYPRFRGACLAAWPRRPAVCFSTLDWYFNEGFKFLAAHFAEQGTRLVGYQHGGAYRTSRSHPSGDHELRITDRWFSYGWDGADADAGRIQPLAHPRFRPLPQKRRDRDDANDLLLITVSYPRYPHRFETGPTGNFETFLDWRRRFVQALPPALRSRLVVRLQRPDFGWGQAARLVDACGPLRFDDDGRPLWRRLLSARLVVVDYYGTSFLEMLGGDVPSVIFWDDRLNEIRPDVDGDFARLREAGILWHSPERAAAKAQEVFESPRRWWDAAPTRLARRQFAVRYARYSDTWLREWTTALEREIEAARQPLTRSVR